MMLVGTSSVWAQDMYVAGSMTNWATNQVKLSTSSSTYSGYYYATFTVEAGTYEYKIKESGNNWWCSTYNTTNSNGVTYSSRSDNCDNIKITVASKGTLEIYHNKSNDNTFAIFYVPCTKSISEESGTYENGAITLSAKFNTCGSAYIGFQWKMQGDGWCYTNDGTETCYKALDSQNKSNEVVETSFTTLNGNLLSGTYVFRPYIVDGSNATNWIYGDEFEVVTCSDPSAGYSISNENASVDWDGTEKEVIITTANGYATPSKIYYDGNETKPTAVGEYTITIDVPSNGTYCAATKLKIGTFTITCPTIAAPAITTSATVCAGTQVTLSNYNGVNDNTVKWYSDEECNSEVNEQVTLTDNDTKYYAKAYHAASGCYSSQYSTLTFTVNALPTISIGDNTNAVKFEDVKLTATGNNIDDVTWIADKGTIIEDATDPKKAVLTYDQTGTVTVTATATSAAGCTSVAATKTVTFSAEKCNSTTTTEQQTVGKTKIIVDNPQNWSTMKCYAWRTSDKKKILGDWSGTEMTKSGNNYEILIDFAEKGISENDKIQVIFNNGSSQTVDSEEVSCNKIYRFGIGPKSGDKYSFTSQAADIDPYTEPVEVTVDPEISAPAAKTISVSTTEGEGNIIFSGQVVKTGCANALTYGFAYSTDANADKSNWTKVACVNTGNTAGTQYNGEKTGIEVDGTYYVCAYITNSAGTTYGAVTEITISTTKTPISNVTLNYCDKNGGNVGVDPNPMCKGATAYVILDYTGSKYSDIKWLVEGVETNLVTDEGDGVWSYEIQGDGSLSVELKNDANTDPAWPYSNKLAFTIIPEPTAPYISIDPASGVICQGSSATIKVENPSADCSYKLVEERPKAGFEPYKSGDLKYTVQNVAKYYVVAQHNACTANEYTSNQVAINQIISTNANISIEPEKAVTTPWEPVTITVKPDAGYIYKLSYTDGNLAAVDGVRIKQNGDSYTYYIPRPDSWGTGNATSARETVNYGIEAQLKVDGEESTCKLKAATAIIQLKDEDNEDCD